MTVISQTSAFATKAPMTPMNSAAAVRTTTRELVE